MKHLNARARCLACEGPDGGHGARQRRTIEHQSRRLCPPYTDSFRPEHAIGARAVLKFLKVPGSDGDVTRYLSPERVG